MSCLDTTRTASTRVVADGLGLVDLLFNGMSGRGGLVGTAIPKLQSPDSFFSASPYSLIDCMASSSHFLELQVTVQLGWLRIKTRFQEGHHSHEVDVTWLSRCNERAHRFGSPRTKQCKQNSPFLLGIINAGCHEMKLQVLDPRRPELACEVFDCPLKWHCGQSATAW